ncbi:MAG: fibrobacter succinogenes major paralogous domain-containing protein, partial [Prevotellaceae bacterium]|nr:fibrobacter succinogenes major paralogous domain-containing protein [Prevotellaceae bacterium]
EACPPGWSLPSDDDFEELASWLNAQNKWGWSEWNSGFALAGGARKGIFGGEQGLYGSWWSSNEEEGWYVGKGDTNGTLSTDDSSLAYSVRCVKEQ